MLSVFDKVFKRPDRLSAENRSAEPNQASPLGASQVYSKPGTEIIATQMAPTESTDLNRDIVFIDGAVENISHLLRELDPAADLYVLHLQSDGLEQISDYLFGRENLLAIHLFCNGGQDFLNLGSATITKDRLSKVQLASLMRIGTALAKQSDFLIYGCDLGANEAGAELISNLSEIIGADIAVSPQVTGGDENATEAVNQAAPSASSAIDGETAFPAIVGKTNGSNGTVVFDLSGNITYVADPGFYGQDSFEYKVGTGDAIERVKVYVNIVPEDAVVGTESISHFNVLSESQHTSITSNYGLSLVSGEPALNENGEFELARTASDLEPLTVSVNLQMCGGEGSPSLKIAVAPSNFLPPRLNVKPIETVPLQETPLLETRDLAVEPETKTEGKIEEPKAIVEPEVIAKNSVEAATETPLQFEDFSGGTLSFPFDPQLQEPALTGNSILGRLIVDSYVRPGTLFLDVNNSFDPKVQGVVSHYSVKQANGSPLPDQARTIRDGFFAVNQSEKFDELDLLIEAELLDGHIASCALRVNIETGKMEALAINGAADRSKTVTPAPISARVGSKSFSSTSISH